MSLFQVNGQDLQKLLSREVIGLLRSSPNEVQLLVKRPVTNTAKFTAASNSYMGL